MKSWRIRKSSGLCLLISIIATSLACPSYAKEYSLDELFRIALERAEMLKISEEGLRIAESNRDKAFSVLFPKVSTFGSYTKYSTDRKASTGIIIQPDESISWGLRLDHSLSLSGKEITALNISGYVIERSKYDVQAAKEEYLLNVATSYYDVLKAKKAVEIAKTNHQRLTRHRDAAIARLKAGEVTKTDLLRAEAELSGAQAELARAENNLRLAKAVLARVVGLSGEFDILDAAIGKPDKAFDENDSLHNEPVLLHYCSTALSLDCLKQVAFAERSELKAAETQKKIAENQIRYTEGAYWPSLLIQGMYLRREEDPASIFLNKESLYAGLTLNFPIFEGGLRKAEVREAESRLREAEYLYEDIRKTIGIEVEKAYLELTTQKEILKSLKDRLNYARDNYKTVSRQYELGLANSIDVIDANTLYLTAEVQLSEAMYNYKLSWIRLERATGTLLRIIRDHRE